MFVTFLALTIFLVPVILIVLVIFILINSFADLKTIILLTLLCVLIIGVQFDIIFLILPYPIATLIVLISSITNKSPKLKA